MPLRDSALGCRDSTGVSSWAQFKLRAVSPCTRPSQGAPEIVKTESATSQPQRGMTCRSKMLPFLGREVSCNLQKEQGEHRGAESERDTHLVCVCAIAKVGTRSRHSRAKACSSTCCMLPEKLTPQTSAGQLACRTAAMYRRRAPLSPVAWTRSQQRETLLAQVGLSSSTSNQHELQIPSGIP